jgi:hypothetical protein
VEDNALMLTHAVEFYKNLFGSEQESGVKLDEELWSREDRVTLQENDLLEAPFSEDEIKKAIFESYADGAPGPDGFSFMFYHHFWDLIKGDFMRVVKDFESVHLNLDRLNYAVITLIPKEPEAKLLKKFRPISLLNCSFKIFGKAINNRLIKLADRLILKNQSSFIKGRFILESVVAAHEIIHDIYKNKESGVVLKLDYEKAYDRVTWSFLEKMLISRGFGEKWVKWVMKIVKGGISLYHNKR